MWSQPNVFSFSKSIAPRGSITETFTIVPRQARELDVMATFDSDQLTSIDGSATITPML
jgi:hypothetical protein